MSLWLRLCVACVLAVLGASSSSGQCTPVWQPFDASTASLPGVNGQVQATAMWDPDGPGPQTPRLVVGGSFSIGGNTLANNIAAYDLVTGQWSALGSGVSGTVSALAVLPNGDLVAGGSFSTAGGASASSIARWNGSAWSALGSGMGGTVFALAVLPNGNLVAGGNFSTAGGVQVRGIARWNGSAWSGLGSGFDLNVFPPRTNDRRVLALAVLPNGDLVAGGEFNQASGITINSIARWNGSFWSPLGSGIIASEQGQCPFPPCPPTAGVVTSLAVLPNGNLMVGGLFTSAGGVPAGNIARWNGSTWSAPSGIPSFGSPPVSALAVLPNGDLVAGGSFSNAGGVSVRGIARWNGSVWSALGTGMGGSSSVFSLSVLPNGDLVAGGFIFRAGGEPANNIARWNGSAWSRLGSGTNDSVNALPVLPNGDLVAGGEFTTAGSQAANCIARWNGSAWSALGSGMSGASGGFWPAVNALAVLPNGDLVAGGDFTSAGGVSAIRIARWNGSAWSALGSGLGGGSFPSVGALAVLPSGDLVAGGNFTTAGGQSVNHIARWNGSAWSALGSGMDGPVSALAVLPNGDLVAGGQFTTAGGVSARRIARWNGSAWSALAAGMNGTVSALRLLPNGDLVAGGEFTTAGVVSANRIARWNGSAWSALGSGLGGGSFPSVGALAVLPSGDLVAGGNFTTAGGQSVNHIARWNGSAWSALGSGMDGRVSALAVLPTGDLVAGGRFSTAGGVVAPYIARWGCPPAPPCPGDWNSDGVVDFNDFLAFLNDFNLQIPRADINQDGAIDFNDLLAFLNLFNTPC